MMLSHRHLRGSALSPESTRLCRPLQPDAEFCRHRPAGARPAAGAEEPGAFRSVDPHSGVVDEQTNSVTDQRPATVGLMADPGMPGKVAAAIADDLADDLQRERGGRWVVEAGHETLPLGPDGEIRLTEHAPRLLQDHEWDFVLYLTDLPTRPDGVPLLYDMSGSTAAALEIGRASCRGSLHNTGDATCG